MYRIYIRQPWDTEWVMWNPRKTYLTKWYPSLVKVPALRNGIEMTDRTEFKITRGKP